MTVSAPAALADPAAALAAARALVPALGARAADHDAAGTFPAADFADLRTAGLLGLMVPPRLGGPFERPGADVEKAWQSAGLPPDEVGKRVLDAVAKAEFFIFTHEEPREWIEARHRRLMAGFDSIARYKAENRET